MVVARTRAEAEDAAERIVVEWQELPAVTDKKTALDPATPVLHAELGDNLAFRKTIDTGAVDAAFAKADLVIEETFEFGRHTAVSLEPRALLAAYDKGTGKLTITTSSQCPHMLQHVFARNAGRAPAQCAGDRTRRRRLVRPQDPHLRRRIGGNRGGHPARTARQVHRRPPGIVRLRHSRPREHGQGAHRREQIRHDRGLRHRRAVRRRRLFAISAHQRVRGHPGAQHHRRSLPAQALPGARHRGLSEQGADLAVSRRRPPDRQYGGRASRRSGRLQARHRPDRDAAAQHHARRRLSRDQRQRHQAQGPVAPALPGCLGRTHELCRPARGADASAERRHPPRHRHRHLHQGHGARPARLLRHRRRADLLAGRLRDQARAQRRHHLCGRA